MENGKVGLVTLFRDNFGSILQAYATYNYISSLGYRCTLLEYDYSMKSIDKLKMLPVFLYRVLLYKDFWRDYRNGKEATSMDKNLLSKNTKDRMNSFIETTFEIRKCNRTNIKTIETEFDYFVVGSDQVWNGYSDFAFLTFSKREKRVALAPSFGKEMVSEYNKKKVAKALKGFDFLSVREESGVGIIKKLTGENALRLSDPTILLDKNDWRTFSSDGMKKESYILIHFLNKPNQIAIETIHLYLQSHNCQIYCICNKYKEYFEFSNCEFLDIDPCDYVSLIDGANVVFTDSFHSTLFCLNMETQFFTFERQYSHGISQKSRIVDLLDRTGMQSRYIVDKKPNDFDSLGKWDSDLLFDKDRVQIRKYINDALMRKGSKEWKNINTY